MHIDNNWQNYRSLVNKKDALFAVNLNIIEYYQGAIKADKIVQFSIPYIAKENGLPCNEHYQELLDIIFKISSLLSSAPATYYAGYLFTDGKAKLHFYTEEPENLLEILPHFNEVEDINVQEDAYWDTYFDFLLPSPLEMKLHGTQEVLDMLIHNGKALNKLYALNHTLYFAEEQNMHDFIEYMANNASISFISIQHSSTPVTISEDEQAYIIKIEQQLYLNTTEIFDTVKQLEKLASQYSGVYFGWESEDTVINKNKLN